MKVNGHLKKMIDALKIPSTVEVKLVKSKRAPLNSNLIYYRHSEASRLEYTIEYRKSLSIDTLKHELCHLKLYLIGLPIFELEPSLRMNMMNQVLNTLHEDYYVDIILEDRFPDSFSSMRLKVLSADHHSEHFHGEVDDNLLSWILQRYILKIAVFETLGYMGEAEILHGRMEHLKESLNPDLNRHLDEVKSHLMMLPPLDRSLRKFTVEEIDIISGIVYSIKKCGDAMNSLYPSTPPPQ
ncbi:MAG: hypothetical protein ACUVTM_04525 [Candidatus Bathyarchaeia archaeon]